MVYHKPPTDRIGERLDGDPPRAVLQKRTRLDCGSAISEAAWSSLKNIYLYANLIYFAYAISQLYIDYYGWDYSGFTSYPDQQNGDYYPNPYGYINALYIGMNFVHLVNAIMYVANWMQMGYPFLSVIQIPEFFNIIGAALYISSSFRYNEADKPVIFGTNVNGTDTYLCQTYVYSPTDTNFTSPYYDTADCLTSAGTEVRALEMAASAIDLLAAFGWCLTWWMSYERRPGQGWTLDDPDTWSNSTTLVGAIFYFVYNVRVSTHADEYWDPSSSAYSLYQYGDIVYFIGSVFYILAALRDDGWFFWMPVGGRVGWEYVELPAVGSSAAARADQAVEMAPTAPMAKVPDWPQDTTTIAASPSKSYGTA